MSGDIGESAAPAQSTTDIATSVMERLDSAEATPATPDATPETPAAPAVVEPAAAPPQPTPEELSAAAKFLVGKGHKWGKRADGKTDLAWLPATSVANFLEEYTNQHKLTWDGEKNTLSGQLKELQEALNEQRTLITGDPKHYLSELAKFDQRYSAFLEPQKAPPAPEPMRLPDPDVTLADGSRTFSMEAFQQSIIPFIVQQAKAEAKAEAEGVLKPLKEAREREEWERGRQERAREQMTELSKMPLFGAIPADGSLTEFQQKVLKVLQDDSVRAKAAWAAQRKYALMTPKEAYWEVAGPLMATDRNSQREELLKELDTAAKAAPSVSRSSAETTKTQPVSTADITRKVMSQLERA